MQKLSKQEKWFVVGMKNKIQEKKNATLEKKL